MEFTTFSLASLLQLIAPIVGFAWALRNGKSRGQIVIASALGGMLAGFVLALPFVRAGAGWVGVPYVLLSAVVGAGIGFAGLVARSIGAWLGRRP